MKEEIESSDEKDKVSSHQNDDNSKYDPFEIQLEQDDFEGEPEDRDPQFDGKLEYPG